MYGLALRKRCPLSSAHSKLSRHDPDWSDDRPRLHAHLDGTGRRLPQWEQLLALTGALYARLLSRPAVRSFEHGVYLGAAENDHC
jgi:hypothetical protein